MAPTSTEASLKTFNNVSIDYETAYGNNELKRACIDHLLTLLPPSSHILDVGCGTGRPVAEMLSSAGHEVLGLDVSEKMIGYAISRVQGTFLHADLLTYQPTAMFAAVCILFSHLQLTSYGEFHGLMFKYASCLLPDGFLVLGTMPADHYVQDVREYDATGTYAVDVLTPFMGEMEKTFFLTEKGLVRLVESMGLEIVSHEVGVFTPEDERCVPEHQQYLIARRVGDAEVLRPRPEP